MRRLLVSLIVALPVTAMAQGTPPEPAPTPEPTPTPAPDPAPAPADRAPTPPPEPGALGGVPVPDAPKVYDPDAPPPSGTRLMLSDLTVFRLNPLGLETRARFGFQKRLYYSEKAITKTNFWFAGIYPKLNPAAAMLGVGGEIQPVSIFNLRAFAEVQQYFGTFGYLQSFPSADANYSDAALKELRDSTDQPPQATQVFHATIAPLLQLKVGPVAIRGLFQLDYWDFKVRDGDVVAYEATYDTLLPDRGWTLSTDTDVLYTGRKNLAIGLRHSLVKPFYKARNFADAAEFAAYDNQNAHQRLGLFAALTLKDKGPSRYNKSTVILIVSWYLTSKYRTGEPDMIPPTGTADDYISRAFPYLLLGYAFESDFMTVR